MVRRSCSANTSISPMRPAAPAGGSRPAQVEVETTWAGWLRAMFPGSRASLCRLPSCVLGLGVGVEGGTIPRLRCNLAACAASRPARKWPVPYRGPQDPPHVLYVCHEKGTRILDPDSGQWMNVEDHPTAWDRHGDGFEVRIGDCRFTEVVTPEHRYWARG